LYCSKCGGALASGVAFCGTCGQATYVAAAPVGGLMVANPVAIGAPAYAYAQVAYAGFWLRFVAYLIDALVLSVCFVAILIPLIFLTGLGTALEKIHPREDPGEIGALLGVTAIFAVIGIAIVGTWVYHAYMESSDWQATVGKRALNLKVTDLEGRPVSFGRASGRHFAKIISGLIPLGIGYIIAGFTDKKQAIHDMVASCLVLRNL
jgi:uncharacterized RDD family membrane protein YckC